MTKSVSFSKSIAIALCLFGLSAKAQLVINEVSQGGQNPTVEYVELVVTGTNTCTSTTQDLRKWIIDDNNGNFLAGTGSGIAQGCIRLKDIPFWQNIKIGTLILIYDDGVTSVNPLIPADDLSTNDGNCRLVIPYSNTSLLEKHGTQPSNSTLTYPTTNFTSTNNWTAVIGMKNGGDAMQLRNPANLTLVSHSVSWGDNSNNVKIFFPIDAGKKVFNMKNLVNNDPFFQANWTADSTLNGETPGVGNSAQNTSWINSLNNNCQPFTGIALSITSSATGNNFCVGDSVTLTSSLPFGNLWSTGDTNSSILIVSTANLTLSNPNACNQITKSLTFTSTSAS